MEGKRGEERKLRTEEGKRFKIITERYDKEITTAECCYMAIKMNF